MCQTKTRISLRIRAVWSKSSLSVQKCSQWRFWSDCANARFKNVFGCTRIVNNYSLISYVIPPSEFIMNFSPQTRSSSLSAHFNHFQGNLNTAGRWSAIFTRETTFMASCLISCTPIPFCKGIYSIRKYFADLLRRGSNYLLRVESFSF